MVPLSNHFYLLVLFCTQASLLPLPREKKESVGVLTSLADTTIAPYWEGDVRIPPMSYISHEPSIHFMLPSHKFILHLMHYCILCCTLYNSTIRHKYSATQYKYSAT